MVYLDYNASTPIDERVLETMIDVYRNNYGNADSRTHNYGENARMIVEKSRQSVADLLGIKNDEVFFTSGATESNNIAVLGLRDYGNLHGKKHIITTAIEHKSVMEPVRILEKSGFEISYIKPNIDGVIDAVQVLNAVRKDTLLVSVMHVNNETGVIQPILEIGEQLSEKGILFHIDAAQSFGKLVDELRNIKYDMLSASAHKMYGPQGIGTLVLRKKRYKFPPVAPIMYGGNQEHSYSPGTVPTALVAGFGKACEIAGNENRIYLEKCYKIKNNILSMLEESGLQYYINGDVSKSIANTLNIAFKGISSEALMLASRQYLGISNGSACNSSGYNISYVLESMGISSNLIQSSVRISWGADSDIKEAIIKLLSVVGMLV